MTPELRAFVGAELDRPPPPEAGAFAAALAQMGGSGVSAVLFYGSAMRTGAVDGVLDFYVLTERMADWPQPKAAAWAGRLLPPNVEYRELETPGARLRAKVAVLSVGAFRRLAGAASLDTTVWARFVQPTGLAWVRDGAARAAAVDDIARCAATAGLWAARLGPAAGRPDAFWNALFARTYAAELRIEPRGRERAILGGDGPRWAALLPLAWAAARVGFERDGEVLRPRPPGGPRGWAWRRALGKPLTVLRLAKAVFTFQGAADYAAWKIARHTGVEVEVTPWRRRHPILASPGVAWLLWRRGVWR